MAKKMGTKGWLALTGVTLLMAALAVPAFAGAASASPVLSAAVTAPSSTQQWAYGGQGWSNGTWTVGNLTETWNASFGWAVIFTATADNATGSVLLEEQRTVGVDALVTFSAPHQSLQYTLHAMEADTAFANLTTGAVVYVNGSAVPALGIDNASTAISASVDQSVVRTLGPLSASAYLNVTGNAHGSVQFAPALGLIPLNLTGVDQWNSSAIATPAASWAIGYAWSDHGLNGTSGSGSGSHSGNWTASGPVFLTGFKADLHAPVVFRDHQPRTAIVLIVQGGADLYDGFILVPHGFDMFGGSGPSAVPVTYGSASIASGEVLFLTPGRVGASSLTAAQSTFGASPGAATLGQPVAGLSPSAAPAPGNSVTAQPMTVPAAQAESSCLANGCASASSHGPAGMLLVLLVAAAVVVIVGSVGVIEWRSYARRKSQKGLVGGYGESWPNGVPPAAAAHFPQAPTTPAGGPSGPEEPVQKL
jgi:hypothetical protein